ncbi:MAG: alpha/beta hydrolase, partial [Tardiphaga sp.]|uniref:alpha/beta fold hydrolase n=1 Tax=Tardiphaga sp. TaxID=1926292 RepID=UPI00198F7003|nr:alpha/beta hydrolase [Tardiphaga sp.]
LVRLKPAVAEQAPRYRDIRVPTVIIAGSADTIVSTDIHSGRFAAAVPGAKLIVLPNVGHMVQDAAPDLICREIESMISAADIKPKAATR